MDYRRYNTVSPERRETGGEPYTSPSRQQFAGCGTGRGLMESVVSFKETDKSVRQLRGLEFESQNIPKRKF